MSQAPWTFSWLPLFRTDKIPWLFPVFFHFPECFFFFLNWKLYLFQQITHSQFCEIFPDLSSLFKIPLLFPDLKMPSHFTRISSPIIRELQSWRKAQKKYKIVINIILMERINWAVNQAKNLKMTFLKYFFHLVNSTCLKFLCL